MKEIEAMKSVAEALENLEEGERLRVFEWAKAKFGISNKNLTKELSSSIAQSEEMTNQKIENEFSDVAEIDGSNFKIISDLKAKSMRDAAIRIAYLTCYLRRKMLGEEKTNVSEIISQIKDHAAFDSNTSRHINLRDLMKDSEGYIKLTRPAEKKAEEIINELRNASIKGTWTLTSKKQQKGKNT